MKLTRAAEYAIRCMTYLAQKGVGTLISKQDIAEQADIPSHFLAKIAQDLAKAGLITIQQGPKGGFILQKEPARISLLEVVEIMIGEITLIDCVATPESCSACGVCLTHDIWKMARNQLRKTLAKVNFADLSKDDSSMPLFPLKNSMK